MFFFSFFWAALVGFELVVVGADVVAVELLFFGRSGATAGEVRLVEEPGEEDKVAKVHGEAELDVDPGDVALGLVALEVLVRPEVDQAADDHLGELQRRDHHGDELGRRVAHRLERVVRVHDAVHEVVHDDEPPRRGCVLGVREPGVEQHGDVVVPVQENQRLLPKHDEHRVAQLRQFWQHEHPGPETRHAILLDETERKN